RVNEPENNPAAIPPTATADRKNPRVLADPPKRIWFTSGNREIGIAKMVANRSVPNDPRSTGRRHTNRTPSVIARRPGRAAPSPAGRLGSRNTPSHARTNVPAWTLNAQVRP